MQSIGKLFLTIGVLSSFINLTGCGTTESTRTEEPSRSVPTYTAETFFETTTVFGSDLNDDGDAVLVSSDASGVFNAYKYPVDGSEPIQLTQSTEDAIWVQSWLPGEDRILYSSDQGGNELNHLYVRESDGSITDITPGENLKAQFLGWHDNKEYFYVATNERDPQFFDLYQYQVDDFSRELLFTNKDGLNTASISGDGRYVALTKTVNNKKTDLYLLDLHSDDNTPTLITPAQGNVAHQAFSFTPDNSALIYGSNADGEFVVAKAYQLSDGTVSNVYEAPWDVSFLYYSDSGRYRVVGVNQDAQTRLTIVDQKTNSELNLPTLPAGDLRGVNFTDDDSAMVFYINSDTSPNNLYYHKIGSTQVTALTDTLNPKIDSENLVTSTVERFKSFDELVIPGLLYKPHQASASNKVPAIVLVHGGPGGQARKGYSPLIQHLVNNGYAIFDVNNRGSSGYGKTFFHLDDKRHGEDDLQDIVYGKKYLQSLDWVDGERIAVMGGSYGGYMTMAAMAFTDEFELGINIFGVTNWVRTLESIPPWWESFRQALYDELGDPATDKDRLYRISPLFHADKITKPVLVVQGANDPRVLQVESDEMVENIRANGTPVEYVLFDDEGHGFSKKENRITAQKAYVDFLNKYL
ncbi:S9 family peptidase [Alteromonas oceanisediminis]|uniref:S9 family peptidase n=1 Tax=Alteromonas oceanisediminis TaxID=2836180 RepID=UPI001BDA7D80|nr:S9 family peptidase [Alteromonas oceanisediminis]MBT0585611.1 S9 family peptidase [Alteromonas oceanisediminis]